MNTSGNGPWSLRGESCLVTGATSGIGEEIALGLARAGARVAVVGRSRERGEASVVRIRRESGNPEVELLLADLAAQAEVNALADRALERLGPLKVLVNNAGIVNLRRETTVDGLEATFAVNHLAYFQLTLRLLERLRASAPARIVNVASDAHKFGALDLADLQNERRYRSMKVYGQSKTANILFTRELARRLEGTGVTVNCIHPGAVATRLAQQNGTFARVLTRALSVFFRTPAQGADTAVWLATAPELQGVSGRYFYSRKELEPAAHARDAAAAAQLFEQSAKLVGIGLNVRALPLLALACAAALAAAGALRLAADAGPEPAAEPAPELRVGAWANGEPTTLAALRGRVVLLEFWTFGCFNCRNVEPHVRAWHERYQAQGLEVVAVHTPEFSHERELARVRAYVEEQGLPYRVPLDNDYATWRAFGNRYWPAVYLIDRSGRIRHRRVGEGGYADTEARIQALLAEAAPG